MKIVIEKYGSAYRADIQDLPGSPPVGFGASKEVAVANVFRLIIKQSLKTKSHDWLGYIDYDDCTVIDETNGR